MNRCRFTRSGWRCDRPAIKGWTTCAKHSTAGMNRKTWNRIQEGHQ